MKRLVSVTALMIGCMSLAQGQITFADVSDSAAAGLSAGTARGIAWVDFNNDGLMDLFVPTAGTTPNKLYMNRGDGTFSDIAPLVALDDLANTITCSWADFDNDGDLDLVTTVTGGATRLFRNNRNTVLDTTFSRVDSAMGISLTGGQMPVWADFNKDGYVDLYIPVSSSATTADALYRNEAGASFTNVSSAAGVNHQSSSILEQAVHWGDFDNDGYPDLFIGNLQTGGPSFFHRNNGNETFTDVAATFGLNLAGRGAQWVDYNNDGAWDFSFASYAGATTTVPVKLFRNNGDGSFTEVSAAAGMTEAVISWGVTWADFDNDGYEDCFVTVSGQSTNCILYKNNGNGTFTNVTTAAGLSGLVQLSAAWGDYDNDGFMDLYTAGAASAGNHLFRNSGDPSKHWLNVNLEGTQSNRAGVGAHIIVRAGSLRMMREINTGIGYRSQSMLTAHFGLDTNTTVDSIIVRWPSGIINVQTVVAPNQTILVHETLVPPPQPYLSSPANGEANQATTLGLFWEEAAGAQFYRLQVATDSTFVVNPVVDDSMVSGTTRVVTGLDYYSRYYWRVNARNAAGTSPFSDVWHFTTVATAPSAPTLISPPNGALHQPTAPRLQWGTSPGATNYTVQVATDSLFAATIVDDSTVTDTVRLVDSLSYASTYFWRVRGRNSAGSGPYSAINRFRTEMRSNWPMFGQNAQHTGFNERDTISLPLQVLWSQNLGSYSLNPVTVADDLLFVTSIVYFNDAVIRCVRAEDGTQLWSHSFGSIFSINPPSYGFGYVFVQSCNNFGSTFLTAFDAVSGDTVWQSAFGAQWERYFAPTLSNGKVFIDGGSYGGMYAFDATSGRQLWFYGLHQYDQWTPAAHDTVVYAFVGSEGGGGHSQLVAVGMNGGQTVWERNDIPFNWSGWSMGTAPVIDTNANLIFVTSANYLHAVNLTTHNTAWADSGIFSVTPAVHDGKLFAIKSNRLVVFDEITGLQLWSTPGDSSINHPPVIAAEHVFISSDQRTYAVNIQTHQVDWTYDLGGYLTIGNNHLYVATTAGNLIAFRVGTTSVGRLAGSSPRAYLLQQNYPNPFNPSTTIEFSLPVQGQATLIVFNVLGEEVATLVNSRLDAGSYSVRWDASKYPSGVYFYRLTSGEFGETKKLLFIK